MLRARRALSKACSELERPGGADVSLVFARVATASAFRGIRPKNAKQSTGRSGEFALVCPNRQIRARLRALKVCLAVDGVRVFPTRCLPTTVPANFSVHAPTNLSCRNVPFLTTARRVPTNYGVDVTFNAVLGSKTRSIQCADLLSR